MKPLSHGNLNWVKSDQGYDWSGTQCDLLPIKCVTNQFTHGTRSINPKKIRESEYESNSICKGTFYLKLCENNCFDREWSTNIVNMSHVHVKPSNTKTSLYCDCLHAHMFSNILLLINAKFITSDLDRACLMDGKLPLLSY